MADMATLIPALQEAGYGLSDISDLLGAANATDESRYQDSLGLQKAQQAATLKYQMGQLANQRRQIAVEQGRAKADAWYQQQTAQLARDTFENSKYEFGIKTGLGVLDTAAQLRGPASYQQAVNFNRGIQGMPAVSGYLQSLLGNYKLAPFTASAGMPAPVSLDTLSSGLLGNPGQPPASGVAPAAPATGAASVLGTGTPLGTPVGGTGTPDAAGYDAAIAPNNQAAAKLVYAHANKLLPGTLESLNPTEQSLLKDDIESAGGDFASFLHSYYGAKPAQGFNDAGLA